MAREEGSAARRHFEGGLDAVAGQGADTLIAFFYIFRPHRLPALRHLCEAASGFTAKDSHKVKDMGPQDPEIFSSAPVIFLASPPELEQPADFSILDELLDRLDPGAVAGLVSYGELDVFFLAGTDHGISLGEGPAHRFFEKNTRPMFRAGKHHVVVTVRPARSNADDVRGLARQHLPVVAVARLDAKAVSSRLQAGWIFIRDADKLSLRNVSPDFVESVAVIASAASADNSDSVFFHVLNARRPILQDINIHQVTTGIHTLSARILRISVEGFRTCYTRSRIFNEVS